ncbi:MAG: hypothetical protein ACTSU6_00995 [Candidatus Njordarchaeales archaeon]
MVKKMKTVTKEDKLLNYYALLKITSGTVLGIFYGVLNIDPLLAWVLSLIILGIIVAFYRYYFNLQSIRLLNMAVMHGTAGYIVSIIMFWGLTYTLLYG